LIHKWITGRTIKANGRNSWQGSPKRQQEKPFKPEGKLSFRMKVNLKDDKTVIDTSRTNFKRTPRFRKFRRCQTKPYLSLIEASVQQLIVIVSGPWLVPGIRDQPFHLFASQSKGRASAADYVLLHHY
jgi:hypothetical protein